MISDDSNLRIGELDTIMRNSMNTWGHASEKGTGAFQSLLKNLATY